VQATTRAEKWTTIEPNDGAFSFAGAVALQGDFVIAAGVHYKNPLVIGTLRRYDQGGVWKPSDVGWSKSHSDWTKIAWLKSGNLGPTGLAVDAEQHIILVGIGFENGEPRRYVARFHPDGTLDWELPGPVGTEARSVGVQPDGTIYVAGAKRTSNASARCGPGRASRHHGPGAPTGSNGSRRPPRGRR